MGQRPNHVWPSQPIGLANKVERSNSERANKRGKSQVVSFLSPLSSFYRGGGRGGSLLCPLVGFVFTGTPLGATNGPLCEFVFTKIPLKVTNGP
jgi:hypothetical protein